MKFKIIALNCALLVLCLSFLPMSNGQDSTTVASTDTTTTAAASTDTTTAAASTDTTTTAASTDTTTTATATTTAASSSCGGKKKRRKHKWKVVRHPGKKIIKRHRKESKWDLKG
ncbi:probable serine/threonine-protein kinase tsuA [Drosophila montana]|uniref:probable serine/threonine-protein kinase tsuA n=1 Tax=Drosophila montana TaxID=40370 RepID=UPI00313B0BD1